MPLEGTISALNHHYPTERKMISVPKSIDHCKYCFTENPSPQKPSWILCSECPCTWCKDTQTQVSLLVKRCETQIPVHCDAWRGKQEELEKYNEENQFLDVAETEVEFAQKLSHFSSLQKLESYSKPLYLDSFIFFLDRTIMADDRKVHFLKEELILKQTYQTQTMIRQIIDEANKIDPPMEMSFFKSKQIEDNDDDMKTVTTTNTLIEEFDNFNFQNDFRSTYDLKTLTEDHKKFEKQLADTNTLRDTKQKELEDITDNDTDSNTYTSWKSLHQFKFKQQFISERVMYADDCMCRYCVHLRPHLSRDMFDMKDGSEFHAIDLKQDDKYQTQNIFIPVIPLEDCTVRVFQGIYTDDGNDDILIPFMFGKEDEEKKFENDEQLKKFTSEVNKSFGKIGQNDVVFGELDPKTVSAEIWTKFFFCYSNSSKPFETGQTDTNDVMSAKISTDFKKINFRFSRLPSKEKNKNIFVQITSTFEPLLDIDDLDLKMKMLKQGILISDIQNYNIKHNDAKFEKQRTQFETEQRQRSFSSSNKMKQTIKKSQTRSINAKKSIDGVQIHDNITFSSIETFEKQITNKISYRFQTFIKNRLDFQEAYKNFLVDETKETNEEKNSSLKKHIKTAKTKHQQELHDANENHKNLNNQTQEKKKIQLKINEYMQLIRELRNARTSAQREYRKEVISQKRCDFIRSMKNEKQEFDDIAKYCLESNDWLSALKLAVSSEMGLVKGSGTLRLLPGIGGTIELPSNWRSKCDKSIIQQIDKDEIEGLYDPKLQPTLGVRRSFNKCNAVKETQKAGERELRTEINRLKLLIR